MTRAAGRKHARDRARQIARFEGYWGGVFTGTVYEDGKFRTTCTENGEVLTGGDITDLRAEAMSYYMDAHADHMST